MPYMVIGINHDDTTNTVDLMSLVAANYLQWNSSENSWTYGKYSTSNVYSWLRDTCPNGYSDSLRSKMVNMTERWREATGTNSGTLQTRQIKCRLLNPYELFGSSCITYSASWGSTVSDFTAYNYGEHYSDIFSNSIGSDTNRYIFHDKAMSTTSAAWINSFYQYASSYSQVCSYSILQTGKCGDGNVGRNFAVAPVIRLSDNP